MPVVLGLSPGFLQRKLVSGAVRPANFESGLARPKSPGLQYHSLKSPFLFRLTPASLHSGIAERPFVIYWLLRMGSGASPPLQWCKTL